MRILFFITAILLIAGTAFAADIDGDWTGEYDAGTGTPMQMHFQFKADGGKLAGKDFGSGFDIKDGKIKGNKISFTLEFDLGGQMYSFEYKGTLKDNSLELEFDMSLDGNQANTGSFTLTKQ